MINDVMGLVTNFIAAVAAISLMVGGIGVMNIMLVSDVYKRQAFAERLPHPDGALL